MLRIWRQLIVRNSLYYCSTSASSSTSSNDSQRASDHLVRASLSSPSFKYIDQLVNYLKNNFVLHEPGRFLIIPKPYGISCVGYKQEDGGIFKDSVHNKEGENSVQRSPSSRDFTIEDCIPFLSRIFNEPHLEFCVGLKRNVSGPIILPANRREHDNLRKSLRYASTNPDEGGGHHRVLAVVMGRPPSLKGQLMGYSTFESVGTHKEYAFVEGRAKRRAKSGKFAVEGTIEWEVVGSKYGVTLIDLMVPKFARHLPRVALSHLLCPILGDQLYMNRLIEIDGRPALVSPKKTYKGKAETFVPKQLLSHLGLTRSQLSQMPLMWHVYRTEFPRYGWTIGKKSIEQEDVTDLVACQPPPPHLLALIEAIGLSKSLTEYMNRVEEDVDTVTGETTF